MNQLGGYVIRSELGRGGMATVYLAEELLSRRLVALKLLHRELTRSEDARRRFISEMHILTMLEHPNLVRCYHCNDIDGQLMMALEYVQGGTLRARLDAQGRLDALEVCRIAIGVLAALVAAHTNGPPIIHRDLKPENILLGQDGTIKVADFGIAKMLGSENLTTTPHGTLHYMSPEQFEGLPVTTSTDLYSLGVVLYELLAGRRPFLGTAPMEIIRAHHGQAPPPFSDAIARETPPALIRLVFELLRKEPSRRPPNAQVVLSEIVRIVQPGARAHPMANAGPPPTGRPRAAPPPTGRPLAGPPAYPQVPMDTAQLVEQFAQPPPGGVRVGRVVLWMAVGMVALLGIGALALMLPGLVERLLDSEDAPRSAAAEEVRPSANDSASSQAKRPAADRSLLPPPRSSRSAMSEFLAKRDPGGPVPVHPELERTDFTVRVMVRNELEEAQQGARIVADTLVDGVRPRVQIVRRLRNGRFQHWVLVGRYRTRSRAMADKAKLRPILNQGANHLDLSDSCATLGPIVDGVRDCEPP